MKGHKYLLPAYEGSYAKNMGTNDLNHFYLESRRPQDVGHNPSLQRKTVCAHNQNKYDKEDKFNHKVSANWVFMWAGNT